MSPQTVSSYNKAAYYPKFLVMLVGQMFSLLGSQIVSFMLTWWITIETQDAIFLSLSMFLIYIPKIVLGPFIGVWIDNSNRKSVLIFSDTFQAIGTLVLIALVVSGYQNVWMILGFNTIRSICQAIQSPTMTSIIPAMVPKQKIARVNGIEQLFQGIISILSPMLAVTLMSFWPMQHILWIDIVTYIIAVSVIFFIPFPETLKRLRMNSKMAREPSASGHSDSTLPSNSTNRTYFRKFANDLKAGWFTFKNTPGFLPLIIITVGANFLLGPINVLMTYYVNVTHEGTAANMALISMAFQAGVISGSLIATFKKSWPKKARTLVGSLLIMFIGMIVLAYTPYGNFYYMAVAAFIICAGVPIFSAMCGSIAQTTIPQEKLGRISAFVSMLVGFFTPLGYLLSGPLANWIGVRYLFLLTGGLGILMLLIVGLTSDLYQIDTVTAGVILESEPQPSRPETIEVQ